MGFELTMVRCDGCGRPHLSMTRTAIARLEGVSPRAVRLLCRPCASAEATPPIATVRELVSLGEITAREAVALLYGEAR